MVTTDATPGPQPGWAAGAGHAAVQRQQADRDPCRAADRLMIAERISRYGWGYDERDVELLADCFTADAVWEGSMFGTDRVGPHVGREAVVRFLTGFWAVQSDQRRHLFTNIVVDELSETAAVAHAYLLLTASAGGTMTPVTNGPYRLTLRNEAGNWRIEHLLAGFDAPF
jgi:hypothetical protein